MDTAKRHFSLPYLRMDDLEAIRERKVPMNANEQRNIDCILSYCSKLSEVVICTGWEARHCSHYKSCHKQLMKYNSKAIVKRDSIDGEIAR